MCKYMGNLFVLRFPESFWLFISKSLTKSPVVFNQRSVRSPILITSVIKKDHKNTNSCVTRYS